MKLVRLTCESCSAPIPVPGRASFVSCDHCGARFQVAREPSTIADGPGDPTLRSIDEAWQDTRNQLGVLGEGAGTIIPTRSGAVAVAGMTALVGMFAFFYSWFAGLLVIGLGLAVAFNVDRGARTFQQASREYWAARDQARALVRRRAR